MEGLRSNLRVGIQYLEAWLSGNGCVPLYNLMEDAATAEISRSQVWQWLKYGSKLEGGSTVTQELYGELLPEELARIEKELGPERFSKGQFEQAAKLFTDMSRSETFTEFLTLPGYELLP
jgi:malate synthase